MLGFSKEDLGQNGNSSAVSLMQNNRLDVYTIPNDLTLVPRDDPFVEASKAVYVNRYLVGQFLKPDNSETSDFTSFLFQNKRLLLIILSGYLLIIAVTFIYFQASRPSSRFLSSLKLGARKILHNAGRPTFSVHQILLVFFSLFMFINQTLLRSSIKTEKATVNTQEIIDGISKLVETSKTMVVNFEEESILKLALEHSFLGRLAKKRRIVYRAPMSDEKIKELKKERMDFLFFFSSEIYLMFVFSFFASTAQQNGLVAFIRSQIYSESFVRVFYMRRGLPAYKKRFIHKRYQLNTIKRRF